MGSFSSPRRLKVWSWCARGRRASCIGGPSRKSSMMWVTSFFLCLWLSVWPARVIDISPSLVILHMKLDMHGEKILYMFYLSVRGMLHIHEVSTMLPQEDSTESATADLFDRYGFYRHYGLSIATLQLYWRLQCGMERRKGVETTLPYTRSIYL